MLNKFLFLLAGLACVAAAHAADHAPAKASAVVHQALAQLQAPGPVSNIQKSPLPGFYQALTGGRLIYVSDDGRYVLDGRVLDAQKQVDLTHRRMASIRRHIVADIPAADTLVFAPKHPKYTVTVFTDVDCPYCRAFHKNIKQINADGVAVNYVFWPRTGIDAYPSGKPTDSYLKAVSVWCAAHRKSSFDAAMDGKTVPSRKCSNPVKHTFMLGNRIGVDGTPTIVGPTGAVLGGYLTPEQLLHALQQNDAENAG